MNLIMPKNIKNKNGFTAMELLTTIILIGVVTSVTLPNVSNFYSSTRVSTEAEKFVSNVRFARYKAIQEQKIIRLIFDTIVDAYKIQEYTGNTAINPIDGSSDGYDNPNWESVLFETELVMDFGISFDKGTLPNIIYFWPDGFIVKRLSTPPPPKDISEDKAILSEHYLTFTYANSSIRVILNAIGVISSTSYASDELNPTDDILW